MILRLLGLSALALFFIVQMLSGDGLILRAVESGEADISSLDNVWVTKSLELNILYGQITGIMFLVVLSAIPGVLIAKRFTRWGRKEEVNLQ